MTPERTRAPISRAANGSFPSRLRTAAVRVKTAPLATSSPLPLAGKSASTSLPARSFFRTKRSSPLAKGIPFAGKDIPYTPDKSLLPCFIENGDTLTPSCDFPQPVVIGTPWDLPELTFLGDSITQGLGTLPFRYESWVARISRALRGRIAVRNLGLGFARAEDAASRGIWLEKAKTGKYVTVCLGVNDLLQLSPTLSCEALETRVYASIETIVTELKATGAKILLLAIPPFHWSGVAKDAWYRINARIRAELAPTVAHFMDTPTVWGVEDAPHMAKYGKEPPDGHPDGNGGAAMADALVDVLTSLVLGQKS